MPVTRYRTATHPTEKRALYKKQISSICFVRLRAWQSWRCVQGCDGHKGARAPREDKEEGSNKNEADNNPASTPIQGLNRTRIIKGAELNPRSRRKKFQPGKDWCRVKKKK